MNFHKAAANFFQNIADQLQPDKPPLLIPDYVTGEPHIVTDLENQKQYYRLNRYFKKYMPGDFIIVMSQDDNGKFRPAAVRKTSAPYLAPYATKPGAVLT